MNMKIAFVTSGYPPVSPGGAGISSKLIVEGLRSLGVDVDVFAIVGSKNNIKKVESNLWHLPSGDQYSIPKAIGENISSYIHLPDLNSYDLIHVYNVRHLPACILRSSPPILATFNNHMWLCIDPVEHLRDGTPPLGINKNIHYAKSKGYTGIKAVPRVLFEFVGKGLSKKADRYTVQTPGMKEIMEICGYTGDNISIVPNLLDPIFDIEPKNDKTILFVGRLEKSKGPDMVLDAYESLPKQIRQEWNLRILGDGPLKSSIKSRISKSSLENVEVEYKEYTNLPSVYKSAGLLIHASKRTEPFSRCWLEAMASGTPILCSRHLSSTSILSDVAELYDPFSTNDLEEKLERLLDNPRKRESMAISGKRKVNSFQQGEVAQKYKDTYLDLLNNGSNGHTVWD